MEFSHKESKTRKEKLLERINRLLETKFIQILGMEGKIPEISLEDIEKNLKKKRILNESTASTILPESTIALSYFDLVQTLDNEKPNAREEISKKLKLELYLYHAARLVIPKVIETLYDKVIAKYKSLIKEEEVDVDKIVVLKEFAKNLSSHTFGDTFLEFVIDLTVEVMRDKWSSKNKDNLNRLARKFYPNSEFIKNEIVARIIQTYNDSGQVVMPKWIAIPTIQAGSIHDNEELDSVEDPFSEKDELARDQLETIVNQLLSETFSAESEELKVVGLRFGFVDGEEKTRGQVAIILNITKERVEQIENKVLRMLRRKGYEYKLDQLFEVIR